MTATMLRPRPVEKIWGRRDLPAWLGAFPQTGAPIGEVWFEDPSGRERALLIKYLFTSEKLSVQVHPDDRLARRQGHSRGKDEAWWVLSADEGATIGLGLTRPIGKQELRAAACDGSIAALLDWRPVAAGDCLYSPAGTVHAIGAGLALVEIQQNADLTYRLFDYGRDRGLHLDLALEAANPAPWRPQPDPRSFGEGRMILAEGRAFVLESWTGPLRGQARAGADRPVWLIPLEGEASTGEEKLAPGSVWIVEGEALLDLEGSARLLAAYPGASPDRRLLEPMNGAVSAHSPQEG